MGPTATTVHRPAPAAARSGHRRVGYVVAIVVNVLGLYIAHHLLDWGWPAFLTEQYSQLLPIITLSITATILANVAFLICDAGWLRSFGHAVTAAIGFVVALRTYQIFPFDFSGYTHDWSGLARVLLVLAMLGAAIGCLVETIQFLTSALRPDRREG
jgi:hypothetical protein